VFAGDLLLEISDNGVGDTALFMPIPRGAQLPPATPERFGPGLEIAVAAPGWVRLWLAFDGERVVAHCDLFAPDGTQALHRAKLGMGVNRAHRRRGVGARLMKLALEWASAEPSLAWVDLDVIGSNIPARRLYEKLDFELVATLRDAFVIDGESVDRIMMTRRVG